MSGSDKIAEFERASARSERPRVELRLFVAGMGPRSTRAIAELKRLRSASCKLSIVDIYEQPSSAADAQIVAVPTLIRDWPLPCRRFVGWSNVADVARSLGLALPRPEGAT
jgi:circadian clock protein KaiB